MAQKHDMFMVLVKTCEFFFIINLEVLRIIHCGEVHDSICLVFKEKINSLLNRFGVIYYFVGNKSLKSI